MNEFSFGTVRHRPFNVKYFLVFLWLLLRGMSCEKFSHLDLGAEYLSFPGSQLLVPLCLRLSHAFYKSTEQLEFLRPSGHFPGLQQHG